MAGDVNRRMLATIPVLAILLAGCGLSTRTHPEDPTAHLSVHTLQELCDFPKQFFSTRYNATSLKVGLGATKPMTDKIDGGNGCDYRNPEGKYLGYISLFEGATDSKTHYPASRVVTVDGVAVSEVVEPLDSFKDPATSRPSYKLTARIDGWEGELEFAGGDEQGTQAAAPVLVNMIRTLKGA
ncbi:hypothetical protein [Nocardia sp. NPDC050412]|uniref:hypothetical protein n=1 Tax=Nocardia sp. NPDC050412 TaxID=3364320 RepID=UPI0037AF397C